MCVWNLVRACSSGCLSQPPHGSLRSKRFVVSIPLEFGDLPNEGFQNVNVLFKPLLVPCLWICFALLDGQVHLLFNLNKLAKSPSRKEKHLAKEDEVKVMEK